MLTAVPTVQVFAQNVLAAKVAFEPPLSDTLVSLQPGVYDWGVPLPDRYGGPLILLPHATFRPVLLFPYFGPPAASLHLRDTFLGSDLRSFVPGPILPPNNIEQNVMLFGRGPFGGNMRFQVGIAWGLNLKWTLDQ